jgi:transcription elongation factor/antiterminator RfaH
MVGTAGGYLKDLGVSGETRRPDGGNARWYVVHTQPRREFCAKTQLEGQGFRVFLPKRPRTIRHARKIATVEAAFFPRYLFVELDLTRQPWRRVNGTFGVTSLVMWGDSPRPMRRGIVETMMTCVDRGGFLCFEQDLMVGAKVRVAAGPFAEQLAILDRLDDSGRVRVLLEILGRPVPVEIGREFVLAVI